MAADDPGTKVLATALDRARDIVKDSGASVSSFSAFFYK